MPREYDRMKYDQKNSSESSDSSEEFTKYDNSDKHVVNRPCIISPPVNTREKYDSSESERSSPDFSDLCEDKPKNKPVKNTVDDSKKVELNDFSRKSLVSVSSNKSEVTSGSSRNRKFIISFGSKDGHQWAKYNNGDDSISINKRNGPVLHLHRGGTYYFCIEDNDNAKHTFFLTDSPVGGPGSKPISGGFAPISKGCGCFKVDKYTPRYFYYQSAKHMFQGGLIIVHESS